MPQEYPKWINHPSGASLGRVIVNDLAAEEAQMSAWGAQQNALTGVSQKSDQSSVEPPKPAPAPPKRPYGRKPGRPSTRKPKSAKA